MKVRWFSIFAFLGTTTFLLFLFLVNSKPITAQGPSPGANAYANSVVDYQVYGARNTHTDPNTLLGTPCSGSDLSLGGGWVIVDMGAGEEIVDAEGADLKVCESEDNPHCNGGSASPYRVFVSNSPSGPWVSIGNGNGVSEFDISSSGFTSVRYVRVEDRSSGQPDNSSPTPGADIAGFEALHMATYTISGRVTDGSGNPLSGVTVSIPSGRNAPTDANGIYNIVGVTSGLYELIASKNGYQFWPRSQAVSVPPDATNQNFTEWICARDVSLYLQGRPSTPDDLPNPAWYNHAYGNYQNDDIYNTIGRWGCKTSSDAMMISYFGQAYQPPFETNPDILNTWLRNNRGYIDNNVSRTYVFSYARQSGVNLHLWETIPGRDDQSLDKHLCAGRPAILRVRNPYGSHFVVATGKIIVNGQSTYTLNDPAHGQTTLREHYNNTYSRADYYVLGPTVFGRSMLEILAHSPVHLLIIDPLGQKLGYDPRTDTSWNEISKAGYDTEAIAESEGGILPEVKVILIPQPVTGEYNLQVIGYDSGTYEIEVYKTDIEGNITEESFSGQAQPNSIDNYVIDIGEMINKVYLPIIVK
jgi:hypothetical protein